MSTPHVLQPNAITEGRLALNVVVVSGSLQPPSKTRALVDHVVERLAQRCKVNVTVIDLAEVGAVIAPLTSRKNIAPAAEALFDAVERAGLLIVGSPIYKASYSGLFKHFFDLVRPTALYGVPVILTGTGGSDRHALALEHHFRPLFGFFNAVSLPTVVYAIESDFLSNTVVSPIVGERVERVVSEALAITGSGIRRSLHADVRLATIS